MSGPKVTAEEAAEIVQKARSLTECDHTVVVRRGEDGPEAWHYGDLRLRDGLVIPRGSQSWTDAIAGLIRNWHRQDDWERRHGTS